MSSFTVLQSRTTAVQAAALCPTMDLLVIVNTRGGLTLYRSLTWEKVFTKAASDVTESGTSMPVVVAFCASGKALGIGCSEGQVVVLDLESRSTMLAQKRSVETEPGSNSSSSSPILRVAWVAHDPVASVLSSSSSCQSRVRLELWKSGGVNAAARLGMMEAAEPPSGVFGDTSEGSCIQAIALSTRSSLLLSLDGANQLSGFLFGIYQVVSINCQPLGSTVKAVEGTFGVTGFFVCNERPDDTVSSASSRERTQRVVRQLAVPYLSCARCRFPGLEHLVGLHLAVQVDLARLQDAVGAHGRKWKDATRVVLPKLQLLQTVLDGYQLPMSPVQFMYMVAQCGMWHPAALASFSQHWNEQGISRLRSAVDSTSAAIVRTLQLKAIPTATNVCLRCREMLAVTRALAECRSIGRGCPPVTSPPSSSSSSSSVPSSLSPSLASLDKLLRASELVLVKLDEALHEARAAREGMLLYLQFVKDCAAVPADGVDVATNGKGGAVAVALSGKKYQLLFDPRRPRAQAKGPQAHAEAVTGTHLYAYLQDQDLPADVTAAAATATATSSVHGRNGTGAQIADLLRVGEVGGGADADSKAARRSLLQQIKQAKEAFAEAFHVLHDEVSGSDVPVHANDVRAAAIATAAAAGTSRGPRVAVNLPPGAFSCGDDSVVSRLVLRGSGGAHVVLGVALVSVVSVLGELYVVCVEGEGDSRGDHAARPPLHAARVVLNGAIVASALRLRLCVAPPPPPSPASAASPEGDGDDGDDGDDGEGDGGAASRVAAIMGIGEAPSPSSSGAGSPACVFRVDLGDLCFAPLQRQPGDDGAVDLAALRALAPHLAGGGVAATGGAGVDIPLRHRLVDFEIPRSAPPALLLEVSPARGIVAVGTLPSSEMDGVAKVIVLDVECNEDDGDDDDDDDDDGNDDAMEET